MNSATPALLALLLVCSLPAITVVAASPERGVAGGTYDQHNLQHATVEQATPIEIENTTNQLPLTGEIRGSHAETGASLGSAFTSSTTQLQVDHEQYVLAEREFGSANETEQAVMIENAYDQLRDRIESLNDREQDAVTDHAAGDISDGELTQVLLHNYYEATALQNALTELETSDDLVSEDVLSSRQLRADRTILDFQTTTIRTNLDAASSMEDATEQYEFRIQTSQDGYRLSILDGETYVTETVRFDNRDEGAPNQFEGFEANDRAMELYPWVEEHSNTDYHDRSSENLYLIDAVHNNRDIDILLDGGTGEVYREAQEVPIGSLPTVETETRSFSEFELTLNKTPAIGPVELTASDKDTGDPAQAMVEVDGVVLGETDDDGTITYLPPTSEYNLTVNYESGEGVSIQISNG
ncbi:hypothetical protein C482_06729 [Natrialba chahannaoensis JCM 10990]|uniref:Uncharacterized protein n=1 Tax=Natrialba chahannaoensis JCM 10990 TaxID=1227492 RepID=M0AU35_9EURY|nr:hypothetical protein [Natrialba chahannaoensis]ELZ01448.1 hypothetical protein C482_06729 [Natrialba chahannaoensis JCM 10990]